MIKPPVSREAARREFIRNTCVALAGFCLSGETPALARQATPKPASPRLSAEEALKELVAGNARFSAGRPSSPRRAREDYASVVAGQNPSAIVVSCADSRVPPELLFDVGVGDLFIVRVAGNVVDGAGAAVKGSIEYAVAELNVPLIFVLGHSSCGAIKSAVGHIDAKDSLPGAIDDLVSLIKPAVTKVRGQAGDLVENATRANVQMGVERIRSLDPIIAPRVRQGAVKVIGGVYDLRTGLVTLTT